MQHIRNIKKIMKRSTKFKQILLVCVIILFMSLPAGCALNGEGSFFASSGNNNADENIGQPIDDTPDELMEAPELPMDDGVPLGSAERVAFHSTGYLDVNLTAEEKLQVERHFKYYLHKQRSTFERYVQRSEAYLPYVRSVFLEKGVPEEIVYLAIVESGFNSKAVSHAGATGMWQFMRFTGQHYGLAQNAWIDERRDPYKATVAAADYLLKLYDQFGDWHLAIAAYNAGEGKIGRALEQTGASSFFDLCKLNDNIPQRKARLRLETQQYVPRLLAVSKIMRNLEILGFTAPDETKGLNLVPVNVGPGTDLGSLAKNTGMRWEDFKNYNQAYRRTISPPRASSVAYVPALQTEKAKAWLAKAESSRFAGWQQYKVRNGDSLYAIGSRYGVSVDVLRQANNMNGNFMRAGSMMIVPGTRVTHTASTKKAAPARSASSKQSITPGSTIYTVQRGDSLYSIAMAHGVSVSGIQKANNMGTGQTKLMPGQKLGIPVTGTTTTQTARGSGSTIVQKGDTLYGIAIQHNTSVDELVRLNSLTRSQPIMPGQELRLP